MLLDILNATLGKDGLTQQFIQTGPRKHLADDVEYAIRAQGHAHLVEFHEETVQDLPFAGILGDHIPDIDLSVLTVAVDTAHALLQTVGVPGDVIVDHQRAELQVDALTGGVGGHHDLSAITEDVFRLDASVHAHRAIDGHDVVTPLA